MNVVNEPFGPAPPGLHIHESFCSRFKRQPPSLNKSYNKSLHAPQATVFFTALMACPQATRVGLALIYLHHNYTNSMPCITSGGAGFAVIPRKPDSRSQRIH